MSEKGGPKGLEALNLMGLRLGELAQGLKDAAEKLAESSAKDGVKAVVDVRVRTLDEAFGGGGAEAAPRAARPVREPPPAAAEAREPLVDSYDEADCFVLTAELPGAADADVSIAATDGRVVIEAAGARRYRAEVALPEGLALDRVERRLANGILELRIPKGAA